MALTLWQEPRTRIDWQKAVILVVLFIAGVWALATKHFNLFGVAAFLYFSIVLTSLSAKYNSDRDEGPASL